MNEPMITHVGTDRRFKQCKCRDCGHVRRCVPRFDFYSNDDGTLSCEACFGARMRAQGLEPVGFGVAPS